MSGKNGQIKFNPKLEEYEYEDLDKKCFTVKYLTKMD